MKLVVVVPSATIAELDKRLDGCATRSELVRALIRDHIARTPDPSAPPPRSEEPAILSGGAIRGRTVLVGGGGIGAVERLTMDKWVQDL